jgi:hypothetical protein
MCVQRSGGMIKSNRFSKQRDEVDRAIQFLVDRLPASAVVRVE